MWLITFALKFYVRLRAWNIFQLVYLLILTKADQFPVAMNEQMVPNVMIQQRLRVVVISKTNYTSKFRCSHLAIDSSVCSFILLIWLWKCNSIDDWRYSMGKTYHVHSIRNRIKVESGAHWSITTRLLLFVEQTHSFLLKMARRDREKKI